MIPFVLGGLLGAVLVYALYWRAQRHAAQVEEEKDALAEERQIVLDFMHSMADAMSERPSREELFQRIVHASILSTGALSACIFERGEDDIMRGVAVEGLFPPHRPIPATQRMQLGTRARFIQEVLKSESFPVGEGIVGRVAATGRGELITNAPSDPRIVKHEDPALTVRSVIAAPIIVRGRLIGVLCVCNAADGLPFTETDFSLVAALAEQAGLAVHNADYLNLQVEKRRLDVDLAMASEVQQMLLPRSMPDIPGLEIDARFMAAQKVSGDLYDVFRLGDGRIGVAVADVSGKGITASLLMAIGRTLLRQIGPRHVWPSRALSELNRLLTADMRQGMYITMTYAVIDTEAGDMILARAGHEQPLWAHREQPSGDWATEYIASEGMPLGMVDPEFFDSVITDRHLRFETGEALVLFTDGLTEAPNAHEAEFGTKRLAEVLREHRELPAAAINDRILAAVQEHSGRIALRDDYTLVTLKRR